MNIKINKFFNKLLIILLLFILIPLSPTKVFASSKFYIETNIEQQQNNISLQGNYPYIQNFTSKKLETEINSIILSKIDETLNEVSQAPKTITLSYNFVIEKDYLSIMLYFENATTKEISVNSINANIKTNEFIVASDVLGVNGLEYANKVYLSEVYKQSVGYKKITDETPFYVQGDSLYVVFGAGEVSLSQKGNVIIPVPLNQMQSYVISEGIYFTKSEYNVKMLPLRTSLQDFGYDFTWSGSQLSVIVLKDDTEVASMIIGDSKYLRANGTAKYLEFAPELMDGVTYVPISFFTDILGMIVDNNSNNDIVLSQYNIT